MGTGHSSLSTSLTQSGTGPVGRTGLRSGCSRRIRCRRGGGAGAPAAIERGKELLSSGEAARPKAEVRDLAKLWMSQHGQEGQSPD